MPCSVCTCSPRVMWMQHQYICNGGNCCKLNHRSQGMVLALVLLEWYPDWMIAMLKLQRNLGKKLLTYSFWVKICHLTTSAPDGKVVMSLSKGNRINEIWFLPPSDTISQLLPLPFHLVLFTVPPHLQTPLQAFNSSSLSHRPTISYSHFWTTHVLFCLAIPQLPPISPVPSLQ